MLRTTALLLALSVAAPALAEGENPTGNANQARRPDAAAIATTPPAPATATPAGTAIPSTSTPSMPTTRTAGPQPGVAGTAAPADRPQGGQGGSNNAPGG